MPDDLTRGYPCADCAHCCQLRDWANDHPNDPTSNCQLTGRSRPAKLVAFAPRAKFTTPTSALQRRPDIQVRDLEEQLRAKDGTHRNVQAQRPLSARSRPFVTGETSHNGTFLSFRRKADVRVLPQASSPHIAVSTPRNFLVTR
jgi:hypothetical protein